MKKIIIETIPHNKQDYDTVGNYRQLDDGSWIFEISDMGNSDYEFLVALHEFIEWYLTQKRGIKNEDITSFDKKFEEIRKLYPDIIGNQEPGNMEAAPYKNEHWLATGVEKMLASHLKINWKEYDEKVMNL